MLGPFRLLPAEPLLLTPPPAISLMPAADGPLLPHCFDQAEQDPVQLGLRRAGDLPVLAVLVSVGGSASRMNSPVSTYSTRLPNRSFR